MPRPLAAAALLASALAAAGCSKNDACSAENQKAGVLATTRDLYLYLDLLPATIDPTPYPGPAELLEALTATARAQNMDRGWSHLSTASGTQQLFGDGQSVGWGIVTLTRGTQLFLAQVVGGSAAADAGFVRGDEILSIGPDAGSLVPAADLIAAGTLGDAFGPSTAGVSRTFEVRTPAGATVQRTMAKRLYSLDPVAWAILPRDPAPPAGWLGLRTFVSTAEAPLRAAFAAFQAAGATDVVVDVRYNGGGLVSTAELLADLLGGGQAGKAMYQQRYNARYASQDASASFSAEPAAVAPARVAFVTTGATASASEMVPNVLDPYLSVALVGAQTYGKPVGQFVITDSQCDSALLLVGFRLANASGNTDYFAGLPDPPGFQGPLCPAEDDLTRAQGDPLEASTAAALHWLQNGTCPPPPPAAPLAARAQAHPRPSRPSTAQVEMPGLY
jgi:hypothetical protein